MEEENKIYIDADEDEYEPTDSEDEYSEGEKELLKELQKKDEDISSRTKEVFAFSESSSDEDDEVGEGFGNQDEDDLNLADSDIERPEYDDDDDLPDPKYWGKKGSDYYNTDFQDEDYGGSYNEKQRELADLEANEAKSIQLRLIKQLNEKDFELGYLDTPSSQNDTEGQINNAKGLSARYKLPTDFSNLTKKEKQALFEKSSPEFVPFIGDLEGYLEEIQSLHAPVLNYIRNHKMLMSPALEFAQLYHDLALNYCNNLVIYLLLKSKHMEIHNHPVIKRLSQLKKQLNQLEDRHENIIKPQLEALLERITDGDEFKVLPPIIDSDEVYKYPSISKKGVAVIGGDAIDKQASIGETNDVEDTNEEEIDERRAITYQIAKNKGLTPHRKKEQRNPRVKHRGKYRKALIRRRGAVRTPRTEITKYAGEISGIKSTTSRSIKFKS